VHNLAGSLSELHLAIGAQGPTVLKPLRRFLEPHPRPVIFLNRLGLAARLTQRKAFFYIKFDCQINVTNRKVGHCKGLIALKVQVAMTLIKVNKDEELNRRGRGHIVDMTTADPSR